MSTTDTKVAFEAWANREGYDTAHTHDGIKWLWLNPMTAELWFSWQAATEAAKATGTAGDAITMSRADLVSYRNAAFNEGIAEGLDRAARQPAPVVEVKTWQERLQPKLHDDSGFVHIAMQGEIDDLRAELNKRIPAEHCAKSATNRSQP